MALHDIIIPKKKKGRRLFMDFTDVNIKVPIGMSTYVTPQNKQAELERNALLLYPYINDKTISHGKAAEILGISKFELISLYDRLGLAYLSMDISEVESDIQNREKIKGKKL